MSAKLYIKFKITIFFSSSQETKIAKIYDRWKMSSTNVVQFMIDLQFDDQISMLIQEYLPNDYTNASSRRVTRTAETVSLEPRLRISITPLPRSADEMEPSISMPQISLQEDSHPPQSPDEKDPKDTEIYETPDQLLGSLISHGVMNSEVFSCLVFSFFFLELI